MNPLTNIAIQSVRYANSKINRLRHQLPSARKSLAAQVEFLNRCRDSLFESCRYTIQRFHPEHSVFPELPVDSDRLNTPVWLVNPLDGGLNFLRGIEHYSTSIAVFESSRPRHAVVLDHARNELLHFSDDEMALRDGRRIRVTPEKPLESCIFGYGSPESLQSDPAGSAFRTPLPSSLMDQGSMWRQSGSPVLTLAQVGTGQLDGCVLHGVPLQSVWAAILIVRNAGGFVGDGFGGDVTSQTSWIVAGNSTVFRSLVAAIRRSEGAGKSAKARPI